MNKIFLTINLIKKRFTRHSRIIIRNNIKVALTSEVSRPLKKKFSIFLFESSNPN